MKKKKGFTLVELLAVIVILAVILVIAVPQIMSVIESAKKGSIESTAKLIASSADREYTNRKILGKDTNVKCADVANLNDKDYGSCSISFDNAGKATVSITGKGKFEGYTCNGNSTNMECVKGEIPGPTETAAQYFSYKENEVDEVIVKDKNKCVAYLMGDNTSDEAKQAANTLCSGNALDNGVTLKDFIQLDYIPSGNYDMAGLESKPIVINNIEIKNKDKCVVYLQTEVNDVGEENANTLCSGGAVNELTLKNVVEQGGIPSSNYETAGLEVNYIVIDNIKIRDKDKCVAYLPTIGATEEEANILCSGNALVDGTTLKDAVQEGGIPSSNYETAGLEVTSRPYIKKITITGYNVEGGTDVVIPSMIDGKRVIRIGSSAFYEKGLTSVVIPNTVKSIEESVFKNNKLTEVTIPSSVTHIGGFAFKGNQLKEIKIPNSVINISDYAFFGNQLTDVVIPNSVTSVESSAFADNKLTSLTISNGVESIDNSAFAGNQLIEVTIPSSVTSIGFYAFANNSNITIINNSSLENTYGVWGSIIGGGCTINGNIIKHDPNALK